MDLKSKLSKKDIFIIIVLCFIILFVVIFDIRSNENAQLDGIFSSIIIAAYGYFGLLGFMHLIGFNFLWPDFISNEENRKQSDNIRQYMDEYFRQEVNFLENYARERTAFTLCQLGVSVQQFNKIRLELIKMRCLPLNSLHDAENKIKQLIKCGAPIVKDLTAIDPIERTYKNVDFYLNFNDAMYIDDSCRELAHAMQFLICEKIGIDCFDKIVIPCDSNIILGAEVGKLVGKPIIKMRSGDGRIEKEKRWDGIFNLGDKVLIVHDVLVSGEQILHTLKNIPRICSIVGICCLVVREKGEGLKRIREENFDVVRIMDLSDDDIKKLISL